MRILIWISNIVCIAFICGAGNYWLQYYTSAKNPLDKELLIGVALNLIFGFWPALTSLILAIFKRETLNKFEKVFSISLLPIIVLLYMVFKTTPT